MCKPKTFRLTHFVTILFALLLLGCQERDTQAFAIKLVGPEGWSKDKRLLQQTKTTLVGRITNSGSQLGETGIELNGDTLMMQVKSWMRADELNGLLTLKGAPVIQRCLMNDEVYADLEGLNEVLAERAQSDTIAQPENPPVEDNADYDDLDSSSAARLNPLFSMLRPNIYQGEDGTYYLGEGPTIGYAHRKDTGAISRLLYAPSAMYMFSNRFQPCWGFKPYDEGQTFLQLFALDQPGDGMPLNEVSVEKAWVSDDALGNPEVVIRLQQPWDQEFARLTRQNIGRHLAFAVGGRVMSAPRVEAEIDGGNLAISGQFTEGECHMIAALCSSGFLGVPLAVVP